MKPRRRKPVKRSGTLALCWMLSLCVMGMATVLVQEATNPSPQTGQRWVTPAEQRAKKAEPVTQPVKLYKLASTDDVHDWGQVMGAFASGGGSFDKKGKPTMEGRHAKSK